MTLLEVRDLGKNFGGLAAVQDVSFDLKEGELLSLIGPNGAGKTTTFNMINGQLRPTRGSVKLAGRELVGLAPRQVAHLGVGRTFQIAATFSSLTVLQNVQLGLHAHHRKTYSFFKDGGKLYRDQAIELLEQVGMSDQMDRPCSELAYGDIKRVELAIGLANNPRLFLMDEPTAGMSPRERNELMALTKQLVKQRSMAVLFTEHSMDVVFSFSDRIIVLAQGQLIAEGSAEQIRDHKRVREVYFGRGEAM
ncbi:MAG: ABC transporter ATP-binding protein [Ottowia sp.]|nr:ABC transporter ATP-binding protein [Ottowia sp.]